MLADGRALKCARTADGRRIDGLPGLKRAAIPLGTIMVLSSGAALAQDQLTKGDLVQLAVILGVYDNRCEKLAPRLLAHSQRMVRVLDKADVMAGVVVEQEKVDEAGEAKWCGAYRPVVEKYKDGLFELDEVSGWPTTNVNIAFILRSLTQLLKDYDRQRDDMKRATRP